jgi:AcrR family transcriptional regulator
MKKTSPRKAPSQKRSQQMVDDILEASIRVLEKHGGRSFTTIRVAEAAGISVGSLYQYFPNKEALLYQLQEMEWVQTWTMMGGILKDKTLGPQDRLRKLVEEFFRTEYEEANLRRALGETGCDFEGTEFFEEHIKAGKREILKLIREINPKISSPEFHVDLLITTITAIGEDISLRTDKKELKVWAENVSAMLLGVLVSR